MDTMRADRSSIVEVLRCRARGGAGSNVSPLFTYLIDGDKDERHLSFVELDERARSIAARLQSFCRIGDRAVLVYPHGLDYIAALVGCFYAGVVAVPAYPPNSSRMSPSVTRLVALLADSQAAGVLTTGSILAQARAADFWESPSRWIATDDVTSADDDHEWKEPAIGPDDLALLQYTSGSTGSPKGVMLTHRNLLQNVQMIYRAFNGDRDEWKLFVSWLPLYHDMGLIGCVIGPIVWGMRSLLLPPLRTLARPVRWLRAITRYQGTYCAAPNFAYELALRKITPEESDSLDLSSWRVAVNGAEPVRSETVNRFVERFEPHGFRREAFCPSYGLAEATVFVTAATGDRCLRLDSTALSANRIVTAAADAPTGRTFVSVGRATGEERVRIVNPATRSVCPADEVGEIWIQGPNVARGYWNKPEETGRTFGGLLASGDEGKFLRTGDLGFIDEGDLFIVGRIKDLIIINGRNHAPEDIESALVSRLPSVRPGTLAAVSVDAGEREVVVIVIEARDSRGLDIEEAAALTRRVVAEAIGIQVHTVAFIQPGSIPKTSSGKVQRYLCKRGYLEGSLDLVGVSCIEMPPDAELWPAVEDQPGTAITLEALRSLHPTEQQRLLEPFLRRELADLLALLPSQVDPHLPIGSIGLDSLKAVELKIRLEDDFGFSLSAEALANNPSLSELTSVMLKDLELSASPQRDPDLGQLVGGGPEAALVDELFEARAARYPDSVALIGSEGQMTCRELDERSNRLARYLRILGIGAGVPVALELLPVPGTVVGMLAILKAGGVGLPCAPGWLDGLGASGPGERLQVLIARRDPGASGCESANVTYVDLIEDLTSHQSAAGGIRPPLQPSAPCVMNGQAASMPELKEAIFSHAHAVRYFREMDRHIAIRDADRLVTGFAGAPILAVLDVLWALIRGAAIDLRAERRPARRARVPRPVDFSLLYFSSHDGAGGGDKYRELFEAARFADMRGFRAIWLPERHFHPFGGLFPNPAVLAAALATTTDRIRLRAGSVVMPLQNPIRVAEEWAVVDNLSGGRVDLAFAAGWNVRDFALAPDAYEGRADRTLAGLETVRRLWRGESVKVADGRGQAVEVRTFPRPLQPEISTWLTSARPADTFAIAGSIGANVLTGLIAHSRDSLAEKIGLYREARAKAGHDPETGQASVMLHAFLGEDLGEVRRTVKSPFTRYLKSFVDLWAGRDEQRNFATADERQQHEILEFAFEKYFHKSALFGTVSQSLEMIAGLREMGVSEVACLIDFGIDSASVMQSLNLLAGVHDRLRAESVPAPPGPPSPETGRTRAGIPLGGARLLRGTASMSGPDVHGAGVTLLLADDHEEQTGGAQPAAFVTLGEAERARLLTSGEDS
jgi:natural product biosynthesis luciferase-like monooxygenase protein